MLMTSSPLGDTFKYKDDNTDAFIGPFPILLAQPRAGLAAMDNLVAISKSPGLPAEACETTILTTGAHYQGANEVYAHADNAVKKLGMDKDQVKTTCAGRKPDDLTSDCSIAYEVARHLVEKPGSLSQVLWDMSMDAFGKEGTIALVHHVGFYAYICIAMLNVTDAAVPNDDSTVL